MEVMFLEAPYIGKVELCKETLNYLKRKRCKKVALFASVQFINNLNEVKKQLKNNNIKIIYTRQLLGCDIQPIKYNVDCYLYVGDGQFHPLALVYGQKREVVCNNPISNTFSLITVDDIKNTLKRYNSSIIKFLSAKNVGVIISLKPGQYHLPTGLEQKYPDQKFYYFLDNNISFDRLENFPFVDTWVSTACPRLALDDQDQFRKGVVNLNDVLSHKTFLSG